MDFQMPIMDGLTATRKLREQGFTIPVIAMTANAMKGDRERAIESGMNDYLSKPIKAQELFEVIGRYFPEIDETDLDTKQSAADDQQNKVEGANQTSAQKTQHMVITDQNRAGQASAAAEALPISNWHAALELLGGDREILVNMAEMYISNAESYSTNIIEALEKQDAEVLTRALHTLKGIFALFQASVPEQILIKAEHDAQNKKFTEITAVLEDIKRYTVQLKQFLEQKLSS
jgi:two-component system sensor histidine kinase/response regulator